ncbi:MAG TPA: PAS domain S-box protein, partial [bacterium]
MGIGLGFPETGFLQVNEEYCKFLGLPRDQLLNHPNPMQVVKDVTHPEDFEKDFAQFKRLMAGEIDSYQMEKRFIRKNGELRWGQLAVSAAPEPGGTRRYVIGHLIDITERKRAEEALRESEERFRVAFEGSPLGMALGTPEGGWQQTNRAFRDFLKRGPDDPVFKTNLAQQLQANTDAPDAVEHARLHQELVEGKRETFELEKRYHLEDGTSKWGSLHVATTRNADGSIKWLISQRLDITAQKLAELSLRDSEERFRAAFEHAPVALAISRFNAAGIQANVAMCEFLGYSKEEFAASGDRLQMIRDTSLPDDFAQELEAFEKLRTGQGDAYHSERRYIRSDGQVRWGSGTVSITRQPDGRVGYIIAQITDVTERKQTEEALRESETLFRTAFENAPIGIGITVPSMGWVQVNSALERFLGRPREQLLGRANMFDLVREITHPDDFEYNQSLFNAMEAGKTDGYQMEKRYVLPDGSLRWGLLNVAAARRADGSIAYMVSQIADVTALKEAEQALREREATLVAAQRITKLGSWRVDFKESPYGRDGTLRWSDETFRILGLTPGAATPTFGLLRERTHPDDRERVRTTWESAMDGHVPYSIEHRIVWGDGVERVVAQHSEVEYDERTGKPLVARGTVQDVTEQRELERKLLQSQKLESLGLLAGGIAHDFNNLLTGILGYASLALQRLPRESPLRNFVAQIEAGGKRAAELCQQMLAYAGRGRFDVKACAMNEIVSDTLPLVEVSISKKIELVVHLAERLPAVEVDATQIRQIVLNLVTNASDAIGQKAGRITVTTGVVKADREYLAQTYLSPALPEGRYVFLEVSDTGEGMTLDVQKKIFDPFFTTKFTGRGLGLAAVLGIVRAHQGALKVYSEPGQGTTMRLLLPAAAADVVPGNRQAATPWQGGGVALVVDDEDSVREVALRMMEALGYTTLAAKDGREAVELYRQNAGRVSLVLLDLTMPHMDGEETFRAIRAVNSSATVVLMSGFTEMESLDRFKDTGLAAFLQKPFSLDSLRSILQRTAPGAAAPSH